jgi:FAD-dependent urate hydroxylase
MKSHRTSVCVLGAGPYGLSVAAHLREHGTSMRVFGEPLSAWRQHMPKQMFLKSVPGASSISAPAAGYRLNDFCAECEGKTLKKDEPVPIGLFVRYGLWFQENLVPEVENERVCEVSRNGTGFNLLLSSGERVHAAAVVVATGHVDFAHIPVELRAIVPDGPSADGAVSHSSQHDDFARFAGREVAVIGAGQSALETAALLHEAGAQPHLLARRRRVLWADPPTNGNGRHTLRKPDSPLGPGFSLYAVSHGPTLVSRLPGPSRRMLVRRILGPSGAWWLRERVVDVLDVREGWRLEQVAATGGRVLLRGRTDADDADELAVDHVIASTGYRVDPDALEFLSPELRGQIRRVFGWPVLSRRSESSVAGLFFTGLTSAATFGPLLRFVAGTSFAAPRTAAAAASVSDGS